MIKQIISNTLTRKAAAESQELIRLRWKRQCWNVRSQKRRSWKRSKWWNKMPYARTRGQKFFRIEATFRNPVFLRGPKSLDFTGFFAFYVFSNISKFPKLSLKNPYFPTLCRNTFLFCFISLNNFIFPTKLLGFIVFDDCTFLKCYNIFQCQKVCNLLMFLMI